MKRDQPGQPSLFDLLEPEHDAVESATTPPIVRAFDPNLLAKSIIEHNGEPHVTATAACNAIRYGEVIHFREFVKRLDKSEQWGDLSYRTIDVRTRNGARHKVNEPLLTEKQLSIVYMQSKLPHMAFIRSEIAEVFIAYRHGRVRAADAQTEVKLQEETDRAYDHVPAIFEMFTRFQRTTASDAARVAIAEVAKNDRRYPTQETVRIATAVIDLYYRGFCPCCQCHKVCPGTEGTHWGHMKGRNRREVLDGWFICAKCNRGYENSNNTADIYQAYIAYHGHVKAYLVQGNLL